MVNVLMCKGYWMQLPEHAPVPRAGDQIQFQGFTLRAKRVLWEPAQAWSATIECNMVRQDWAGSQRDLFEAAGFAACAE